VINLTLYEYTHRSQSQNRSVVVARRPASSSSSSRSSCAGAARRYAVVKERANPIDASICAAAGDEHLSDHVTRRRHVFTSVSYVIELHVFAPRRTRDTDSQTAFLIHYQGLLTKLADVGVSKKSTGINNWYSFLSIGRLTTKTQLSLTNRATHFCDMQRHGWTHKNTPIPRVAIPNLIVLSQAMWELADVPKNGAHWGPAFWYGGVTDPL